MFCERYDNEESDLVTVLCERHHSPPREKIEDLGDLVQVYDTETNVAPLPGATNKVAKKVTAYVYRRRQLLVESE